MDTPSTILLLVGVVELTFGTVLLVLAGVLVWSIRQLRPQEEVIRELNALALDVEDLEKRYKKIRGEKARARSSANTREEEVDPELADLDPEVRALFPA